MGIFVWVTWHVSLLDIRRSVVSKNRGENKLYSLNERSQKICKNFSFKLQKMVHENNFNKPEKKRDQSAPWGSSHRQTKSNPNTHTLWWAIVWKHTAFLNTSSINYFSVFNWGIMIAVIHFTVCTVAQVRVLLQSETPHTSLDFLFRINGR